MAFQDVWYLRYGKMKIIFGRCEHTQALFQTPILTHHNNLLSSIPESKYCEV